MCVPCKNLLQAASGAACGHCRGGKGQVGGAVSLGVGQRQPAVQRQCEVPAGGGFAAGRSRRKRPAQRRLSRPQAHRAARPARLRDFVGYAPARRGSVCGALPIVRLQENVKPLGFPPLGKARKIKTAPLRMRFELYFISRSQPRGAGGQYPPAPSG